MSNRIVERNASMTACSAGSRARQAVSASLLERAAYEVRRFELVPAGARLAIAEVVASVVQLVLLILSARAPRKIRRAAVARVIVQVSTLGTVGAWPVERFGDEMSDQTSNGAPVSTQADARVSRPVGVGGSLAPTPQICALPSAERYYSIEGSHSALVADLVEFFPSEHRAPLFHASSVRPHLAVSIP